MNDALYPYATPRVLPEPLTLTVLGATGSIGRQTLELAARFPERMQVTAVASQHRWRELAELLADLTVVAPDAPRPLVAIADPVARDAAAASGRFGDRLLPEVGATELAAMAVGSVTVNGIVGAAGLAPTLAAASCGGRIALANKESLVVGGELVRTAVHAGGAELLPVDSEHSALAQCLGGCCQDDVAQLILTASGGPFRTASAEYLATVTIAEVLAHPTWEMGPKITVDSATLMNKGLEVIEAHHLFGVSYDDIEVVVHPGSWVHSLVRLRDGALLAQLGQPDMRLPILYAVTGEQRWPLEQAPLDLAALGELRFEAPDHERFPCLNLARAAGTAGGTAPVTLNAANEVAVAALLAGRLQFVDLAGLVAATLDRLPTRPVTTLATALDADAEARRVAAELLDAGRGNTIL